MNKKNTCSGFANMRAVSNLLNEMSNPRFSDPSILGEDQVEFISVDEMKSNLLQYADSRVCIAVEIIAKNGDYILAEESLSCALSIYRKVAPRNIEAQIKILSLLVPVFLRLNRNSDSIYCNADVAALLQA